MQLEIRFANGDVLQTTLRAWDKQTAEEHQEVIERMLDVPNTISFP